MAMQIPSEARVDADYAEFCSKMDALAAIEKHNAEVTGVFDSSVEFEHSDATSCTFRYRVSSKQLCMNGYDQSGLKLSDFHKYSSAIEMNIDHQRVRFFLHRNKTTPLVLICDGQCHGAKENHYYAVKPFDSKKLKTFYSPVNLHSPTSEQGKKEWPLKIECTLSLIDSKGKALVDESKFSFLYLTNTFLWGGTAMDGMRSYDLFDHKLHSAPGMLEQSWYKNLLAKVDAGEKTMEDVLCKTCSLCSFRIEDHYKFQKFHEKLTAVYKELSTLSEQNLTVRLTVSLKE
ncbi:MAG: hypothetical protein ACPGUD_10960 [Parashewanella sp.]